jgi:hypothetical protein
MSIKNVVAAAAVLLVTGVSAQADTGHRNASTTFRIQGFVPVLCRVQLAPLSSQPDEDGVVSLGVAQEFCNAPRGYRVLVQHAADLEGAAVISQGVRIPLSPTGETVLTDSTHPDIRNVALSLDLGDDPSRFHSIGVRIEAKG